MESATQFVIPILLSLWGVGLQMTGSKFAGILIMAVSSLSVWWLLDPTSSFVLWGGWGSIILLHTGYGLWVGGLLGVHRIRKREQRNTLSQPTHPASPQAHPDSGAVHREQLREPEPQESKPSPIPVSLSREQTVTLITNVQQHNEYVKLKIVSTQVHIELAKQLVTIFRTAGYTFIIDDKRNESIFLAQSPHNKIIVRYCEDHSMYHLDSTFLVIYFRQVFGVLLSVNTFPIESRIDYFQIEIGGAP